MRPRQADRVILFQGLWKKSTAVRCIRRRKTKVNHGLLRNILAPRLCGGFWIQRIGTVQHTCRAKNRPLRPACGTGSAQGEPRNSQRAIVLFMTVGPARVQYSNEPTWSFSEFRAQPSKACTATYAYSKCPVMYLSRRLSQLRPWHDEDRSQKRNQ